MSEQAVVTEQKANPYNANKGWSDTESGNVDRGLITADNPYVAKKQPEPESYQEQDEDKPYKKVDYKKRYDSLKKHYDTKVNEFKAKEQEWVKSNTPKYEVPKTPEQLANFKEQYPEVYETIETVAYQMSQKQIEEMREKLNRVEARELEIRKKDAEIQLGQLHPDFKELRSSPVFHDWVRDQPEEIQSWLYKSLDPMKAAKAISLFKTEVEWSVPKNKNTRQDAAQAVNARSSGKSMEDSSGNRKKVWTTSEIKNLSVHEYDRLSKDIDKAFTEGRVIKG